MSISRGLAACSQDSLRPEEIGRFPVDDLEGIITRTGAQIDKEISSDGKGALLVTVNEPVTVRLYETGDIHLEQKQLIYQTRPRTKVVEGQVYLEMWCSFPGKGSFSRVLFKLRFRAVMNGYRSRPLLSCKKVKIPIT